MNSIPLLPPPSPREGGGLRWGKGALIPIEN